MYQMGTRVKDVPHNNTSSNTKMGPTMLSTQVQTSGKL
jgi:hypothetical protein